LDNYAMHLLAVIPVILLQVLQVIEIHVVNSSSCVAACFNFR
jgi:hypothetical protein